jgi:hypothetical protein
MAFPVLERGRFAIQSGLNVTTIGVSRLKLTFDRADPMPAVELGDNLHLPGASPMAYDGVSGAELGFHVYPEYVRPTSGGAGLVPAGTRQIVAVYEWTDGRGNRHQGAASIPMPYTNAGATSINVMMQTLSLTEKYDNSGVTVKAIPRANVQLAVYATEAAGVVFYRVGSIANDLLNPTVTFVYNIDDATLRGTKSSTPSAARSTTSRRPRAASHARIRTGSSSRARRTTRSTSRSSTFRARASSFTPT